MGRAPAVELARKQKNSKEEVTSPFLFPGADPDHTALVRVGLHNCYLPAWASSARSAPRARPGGTRPRSLRPRSPRARCREQSQRCRRPEAHDPVAIGREDQSAVGPDGQAKVSRGPLALADQGARVEVPEHESSLL